MSRREDRDSDLKRHRSQFHRAPSPKRSRRDGEPANEKPYVHPKLTRDKSDGDQKHRHGIRDQRMVEVAPSGQNSKSEKRATSKEFENVANGNQEGTKHSSDLAGVPRSQVYFQHDDRGSRQNDRSFNRRTDSDRGRHRNPREQQKDWVGHKAVASDTRRKDDKVARGREDGNVWHHDGYFEMEANPKPALHKRRSFREQKITTAETEKTIEEAGAKSGMPNNLDHVAKHDRRDERMHRARYSERPERLFDKEELNRKDARRDDFSSKHGHDARGRDQFTARPGFPSTRGGVLRVEKWKHDLFQEANRSPTPKNEEDQISKIEALLAS